MLKDCDFKYNYSSGCVEPKEFLTEALVESISFDLGLGFFSSSAIRSLSKGFALFIARGGSMRIIINHILSYEDKKAIVRGEQSKIDFEEEILNDVCRLTDTFSREDIHFFNCLSYLISINRLQFVATVSTKGGIGHDKYGIFYDKDDNKVAFIGSANFSSTALDLNGETITTFTSWNDTNRVKEYEDMFNSSWDGDTEHLLHIPIEKVKTHISGKFPARDLKELIQEGINLREIEQNSIPNQSSMESKLPQRLIEKLELIEKEPRFPYPTERQIQIDAYCAWNNENNRKGIFAMATGSGKTITALNCLLKLYQENKYYKAIIVVPTQALALQWEKEAERFNFQNIISTHTYGDWKEYICRYATQSLIDIKRNLVLITTYATFNRENIQRFLHKAKGLDTFLYIADEAHNLGSPWSLKLLPQMINWRIGLSATPERVYDDMGSEEIYNFFNSFPPYYTYRFTMKQAIEADILCHYDYFPIFVELTPTEMEDYLRITEQLRKFIDSETGTYSENAERLLLKRKRIIHKAQNKKNAIAQLLQDLQESKKLDYTFVFVPEGYENRDFASTDNYSLDSDDIHIIDEYAQMFKEKGYTYHKYISGLEDAPEILNSFALGEIQILLSMKCLDEGVDIPRAEHAIFCSSTGNPRQFVQRRGRVLRKCKGKEKASIWDLIVLPPKIHVASIAEKNMFIGELKRVVNFATLADNKTNIIYSTELQDVCEQLQINLFEMLEKEDNQYL